MLNLMAMNSHLFGPLCFDSSQNRILLLALSFRLFKALSEAQNCKIDRIGQQHASCKKLTKYYDHFVAISAQTLNSNCDSFK